MTSKSLETSRPPKRKVLILARPEPPVELIEDPLQGNFDLLLTRSLREPCRTLQTLKYLKRMVRGNPAVLPAKFLTSPLPAVKTPTFLKNFENPYSLFGLALEAGLVPYLAAEGYQVIHPPGAVVVHRREEVSRLFDFLNWEKYGDQISANLEATASTVAKAYPPKKFPYLEYQSELEVSDPSTRGVVGPLQCHPDFVLKGPPPTTLLGGRQEVVILECKSISKKSTSGDLWPHRAQLSVYLAAFREAGYLVKAAGILLPWEREPRIVEVPSIDKYKHQPLLAMALEVRYQVAQDPVQRLRWSAISERLRIGHHVVNSTVGKTSTYPFPVQMFLGGMTTNPQTDSKIHVKYAKGYAFNREVHIHGPYNLLLTGLPYVREAIFKYLETARKVGAASIVFHIGTLSAETTYQEGLKKFRDNLDAIVKAYITLVGRDPPGTFPRLLLETGAGKGIEPCPNPETMARELVRYDPRYVGLCVDTCHVHDAGYSPVEYVQRFLSSMERLGGSGEGAIGLFHFNGAGLPRGSKADKHATVKGFQHIPYEEMQWIAGYASSQSVDMVVE